MRVILISGPSGSGKTTLSKMILSRYQNGISLSTDDYYKTGIISNILSKLINSYYERKISFNYNLFEKDFNNIIKNKKSTHNFSYDFKNKKIKKLLNKTYNIEFIVIEGIFVREVIDNLNERNCFLIELRTSKDCCMERVIYRDITERGKKKRRAKIDFLKSWDFYQQNNKKRKNEKLITTLIASTNNDLDLIINKIFN